MKYLAIDYGQKRTGIAVSDVGGRMAFPRAVLVMRGKDAFFAELLALAEEEDIQAFVVGLPIRGNGEDSETTRQVRNMVERLKRRTVLPVYLMEDLGQIVPPGSPPVAADGAQGRDGQLSRASGVPVLYNYRITARSTGGSEGAVRAVEVNFGTGVPSN